MCGIGTAASVSVRRRASTNALKLWITSRTRTGTLRGLIGQVIDGSEDTGLVDPAVEVESVSVWVGGLPGLTPTLPADVFGLS